LCKKFKMGLINILPVVLIALASTATCQVSPHERDLRINEFPYLVHLSVEYDYLSFTDFFYAGGTIVSERWILTCAHNFKVDEIYGDNYYPITVTVLAGTKHTRVKAPRAQEKKVSIDNVIIHGDYPQRNADIALIFLGEQVLSFDRLVQPAELIEPGSSLRRHSECSVVGWGAYENADGVEVQPEAARKGSFCVLENMDCYINLGGFDDKYLVCVGCRGCRDCSMLSPGDSGSPVVQQIEGKNTVVGLSKSRKQRVEGEGLAVGRDYPGSMVKISVFRVWMKRKMTQREKRYGNERVQRNMAAAAVASVAAVFIINRMFR